MDLIIRLVENDGNPNDMDYINIRRIPRHFNPRIDRLYVVRDDLELGYFRIHGIFENGFTTMVFSEFHPNLYHIHVPVYLSSIDWIYYDTYLQKRYREAENNHSDIDGENNLREEYFQSRQRRL